MKYWHLNTCSNNNKNHMLENNKGYIGIGTPLENRQSSTVSQWKKFEKETKINDIILLYHNRTGYIAYGKYIKYDGPLHSQFTNINILAPDWRNDEIQTPSNSKF